MSTAPEKATEMQMHSHSLPAISVEKRRIGRSAKRPLQQGQIQNNLQTLQREDPDISMVLRVKKAAEKPEVDVQKAQSLETHRLLQLWEELVICDGILFRRWENHNGTKSVYQLIVSKSRRCMMEFLEVTWERPKC